MGSTESGPRGHNWATEPIAIIGLSCKLAGDASDAENLWTMLAEGRDAWSEIPPSRFDLKGAYHADPDRLGTMHVKGAHFVKEDVAKFDAAFFNLSGETAAAIDPQYRLQLESVYEALENAGLPLSCVAGSNTSVYAGVWTHDYHDGLMQDGDKLPRFLMIGTPPALAANRISHFFDLRGASLTLDTGCSSGLVALHQAVLGLRAGEAEMAVVSGCNLMLSPDRFKMLSSLGMLSPDGRSYAFDARANGYGRGEGVVTVVIKRLRDALTAGDPVRAIIRETGLNQDGKTDTITIPSEAAQTELMRECYSRAGLSPRDTQVFEAHGTGTPAGDPIEARAIAAVFGGDTGRTRPLHIGSIKTNIGHTEAASGLASLVKVVLAMEKGQIPPSVNHDKPNPKLELDKWGLQVTTELEPWPVANGEVRRASINNFGYGGTNSHIILEDARLVQPQPGLDGPNKLTNGRAQTSHTTKSEALVFYGRDEQACERMVAGVKQYLQRHRDTANPAKLMRDLGWTLATRRTRFPTGWVSAHVAPYSDSDLGAAIQSLDGPGFKPVRLESKPVRIGMVFTGQGAQWHAMARELAAPYPVVRATLDEAERILKELGADWSLTEELLARDAATSRVHHTELSIPICVAVQVALVRLLKAWGIEPAAVTSHSSGEIAAAYAVGALDLRQAMAAAYYRGAMAWRMTQQKGSGMKGAMVAVGVGEDAAHQDYLDKLTDAYGTAVVACINSPSSVTIAGDESAVERVLDLANEAGVFARRLKVLTAYHSHHMKPIAEPYRQALAAALAGGDEDSELAVSFSSPVTGGRITNGEQLASPDHWVASLLQPVHFVDAFTDMVLGGGAADAGASNVDVILEVGPHTALGGPVKELLSQPAFQGVNVPYMGCLVRNENARDCMLATALDLVRKGYPVSLPQLRGSAEKGSSNTPPPRPRVLTDLPPYPWNHSIRHWNESRYNRAYRQRDREPHHLLGLPVPGTNPEAATWRQIVRLSESPWLRDHVVQGNVLYPGAGFVCLAIEAMKQLAERGSSTGVSDVAASGYKLQDVEIHQALVVPDNADGIEVQTVLRRVSDKAIGLQGWREFEVLSVMADNRWTQHARGLITADFGEAQDKPIQSLVQTSGFTRRIEPEDLWSNLRALNIQHGPFFQNLTSIVQDGSTSNLKTKRCVATFGIADCDAQYKHVLHPTTLDSVIVSTYAALPGAGAHDDSAKVPRSIRSLWVSSGMPTTTTAGRGLSLACNTNVVRVDAQRCEADITVVDAGRSVLELEGLVLQSLGRSIDQPQQKEQQGQQPWAKELCADVRWAPDLALSAGLPGAAEAIKAKLSPPRAVDPHDKVVLMRLRRVCVYFCDDALAALTPQDVSNLVPHHVKFHGWMQDTLGAASGPPATPGRTTRRRRARRRSPSRPLRAPTAS